MDYLEFAGVRFLNLEMLTAATPAFVAIGTLLVAIGAFVVSLHSTHTLKKHNYASVRPWLDVATNYTDNTERGIKELSYLLVNAGTGTAIVKSCNLLYNGKLVPVNGPPQYLEFIESLDNSFKVVEHFWPSGDTPIMVGAKHTLLAFEVPMSEDIIEQAEDFATRLGMVIEYTSVYENEVFTCASAEDF